MSIPALAAGVDAGSDRTGSGRLLVTEISTVPSGCVVTVGAVGHRCLPTR